MADEIEFLDSAPMSFAPVPRRIPLGDPARRVEPKGVERADDLAIFVPLAVIEKAVRHSHSDLANEVGGVLVGGHYVDNGVEFVEVEAFLRADFAEGRAASFKFTHRTWEAITRHMERDYQDKLIVGWHHSHPGYGVFLSHQDTFIHRNFFNLEWQIALVVDPLQNDLGFFQWRNGQVVDCGFYVTGPLREGNR